jgi:hypothetical protein
MRENKWCYVKGQRQTFFFVPKMTGYEESIELIGEKLRSMKNIETANKSEV